MATNQENTNFDLYRGDTGVKKFFFKDKDGEPFNLVGYIIRSQARQTVNSDTTLFDITMEDGEEENSFEDGIVVLRVPASTSEDLPPQCVYDIQASSGDYKITLAKGIITVIPDVTR